MKVLYICLVILYKMLHSGSINVAVSLFNPNTLFRFSRQCFLNEYRYKHANFIYIFIFGTLASFRDLDPTGFSGKKKKKK